MNSAIMNARYSNNKKLRNINNNEKIETDEIGPFLQGVFFVCILVIVFFMLKSAHEDIDKK